jgi:hypothetical protein
MGAEVRRLGKFLAAVVLACSVLGASSTFAAPHDAASTAAVRPNDQAVTVPDVAVPPPGVRDEAAMVLVGALLIGLAAAVRRAA